MNPNTDQPTGYLRRRGGISALVISTVNNSPRERQESIGFSLIDSPAGPVMIAATRRGLCWIGIHDSVDYLEAELRKDHPHSYVSRHDAGLAEFERTILADISGEASGFELPLDIRATPFQVAVWRELCAIPRGVTRSYGEIARRLGRPEASRAVGHANGSNPLAILIPCHRAIGSNGALTGYRWGLEYKRRLLDHERALAQMTLGSTRQMAN